MRFAALLPLLFACATASAATPVETVNAAMAKLAPQVKVDVAQESSVPGFYEALIGNQLVYVSKDGRFVLDGSATDVDAGLDLTEAAHAKQRRSTLAQIGTDKRIVFAPEKPKYTVTVFTDVDCPFCRRFHDHIAEYNALGIAVEYVFMPLDIHPGADVKSEAVWCASDRKAAFTAAMSGADTGKASCANPVAETTRLARSMGINGTPTTLAPDGTRIAPGVAMSPQQLLAELSRLEKNPVSAH